MTSEIAVQNLCGQLRVERSTDSLRIACTGFVSAEGGSVAAANALLLRMLLNLGCKVDFFSKPSFVDPRPVIGPAEGFRFVPVVNALSDEFRRKVEWIPVIGAVAAKNDAVHYNRMLVRRMRTELPSRRYDAALWLGDYAHGSIPGIPTISFLQGPPGTDARSILRRRLEIRRLAGKTTGLKWELMAKLRLSRLGLPAMQHTNQFIVGSSISRDRLAGTYRIPAERISIVPYPIDLETFRPSPTTTAYTHADPLRLLWLGRIVPRKRLDLFLDGAALAIRRGCNLEITVVGAGGFVPGYETLLTTFPFQQRLHWIKNVSRAQVPRLLQTHDVLAQPSEEENFGSSVAEAQACGLPVIVGTTNGNADYLCSRDIRLAHDEPETFADALVNLLHRREEGNWGEVAESRRIADTFFDATKVTKDLLAVLKDVCERSYARQ